MPRPIIPYTLIIFFGIILLFVLALMVAGGYEVTMYVFNQPVNTDIACKIAASPIIIALLLPVSLVIDIVLAIRDR